jgi:putative ABC transport system permease protein
MPHVERVMPTLVKMNSCATNLDLVNIHGVDAKVLRDFRRIDVIEGSYEVFIAESGAALIGRELARRRGFRVGDSADINGINFNVRAIFEDGGTTYESLAIVHLHFLQQALKIGAGSYSTQLYVKVDDPENSEAVAALIDEYFSTDAYPTDTKPEAAFLSTVIREFEEVIDFSRLLGYITVGIILLLVANTIYMATQDRIKETAVLRTLGFTPARVIALIVAESVALCAIGGLIGGLSCFYIIAIGRFSVGIEGYQVAFTPSAEVLTASLAASLTVGLVGGLLPSFSASRQNIVEGLRKV